MNRHILVGCAGLNSALLLNYLLWYVGAPSLAAWVCVPALLVAFIYLVLSVTRHEPSLWPIPVFLLALLLVSLSTPAVAWDARSIWLFHAKRIFLNSHLFAQLDGYAPWSHNDYPVIIPALSASMAGLLGVWNEVYPKSANIFFLITPLFLVGAVLRHSISIALYISAVIYVCSHYLHNGFADANVAVLISSLLLIFFKFEKVNERDKIILIYILATSLSILCLVKNEGIMLSLIYLVLLGAFNFSSKKLNIAQILSASATPIFFTASWKIQCVMHNVKNDSVGGDIVLQILTKISNTENVILIGKYMISDLLAVSCLLAAISVFAKTMISFRANVIFCITFCLAYSGVVFLVYLSTPHDLAWHLNTSASRVMMAPNMVIIGVAIYILTLLYESGTSSRNPTQDKPHCSVSRHSMRPKKERAQRSRVTP